MIFEKIIEIIALIELKIELKNYCFLESLLHFYYNF